MASILENNTIDVTLSKIFWSQQSLTYKRFYEGSLGLGKLLQCFYVMTCPGQFSWNNYTKISVVGFLRYFCVVDFVNVSRRDFVLVRV